MNNDLSILVCSSDGYEDVWRPFFTLFFRYWPSCPYPVYLMSNFKCYKDDRVTTLAMGRDVTWSSTFRAALQQLQTRKVLVVMEDYLLARPVRERKLEDLLAYMDQRDAVCMRLFPEPGANIPSHDYPGVGEISFDEPFRVCLQAAIWDREALTDLVLPGESAWDFEIEATKRSREINRVFLSVEPPIDNSPFAYYCTGVVRGKWMPGAIRLCKREGIPLDLQVRPCAWLKGWLREIPLLLPIRRLYVALRRASGLN